MTIDLGELSTRESEQVEWKEQVADVDDLVRTLVAFANDLPNLGGGRLVCGAREFKGEDGFPHVELLGLTAARLKEIEQVVLAQCRDRVHPPIAPQVDEVQAALPDTRVLIFTVLATGRAHVYRDRSKVSAYWVRIGRDTREARNGLLLRLLSAKGEVEPWDRRPVPGATVDDLDLLAIRDTLTQMGAWDPSRPIEHWLEPGVTLSSFIPSLCTREPPTGTVRPRNFAILLFGREPQRWIPGAYSVFSLYPGPDRSEPYADRLELDGTVVVQLRRLIERLNTEAVTLTDKTSGLPPNVVKYPQRALQEAVVNALAHRDYLSANPVRITVFSDRVEVWSPGGLDPKVEPEVFRAARASPVWRNQSLAWAFLKLRLAQNEGQGIPTILRTMAQEGCPPPTFELGEETVRCVLPAHPRHARMRELRQIETEISLGRVDSATERLQRLLDEDPHNFRTLLLLTDLARSTGDDAAVLRFLDANREQLPGLPAAAQLALADTLATTGRRGHDAKERRELARTLLRQASQSHVELGDARRLVISYLALHAEDEAMNTLSSLLRAHPDWQTDPALLQLRGRTWIQFAKRCGNTLRRPDLTARLRQNARRDFEEYLQRAERDLRLAIENGATGAVLAHAQDDLVFLERLRTNPRTRPPR